MPLSELLFRAQKSRQTNPGRQDEMSGWNSLNSQSLKPWAYCTGTILKTWELPEMMFLVSARGHLGVTAIALVS